MSTHVINARASTGFTEPSRFGAWTERYLGVTTSGLAFLGFAVLGWLIARWIGSFAMFLLAYGAVAIFVSAFALGRRRLHVEAQRSALPTRVREGQFVEAGLRLKAQRRVSTITLQEELDPHLGPTVRVPIMALPANQEIDHSYAFRPNLRGVYDVGPLTAVWSDPFGFTRKRVVLMDEVKLIVHPTTEAVDDRVLSREWEDPPIRPPVSKPWPNGFEFYGMRDYVPGDDPRRIVWRATARSVGGSGYDRYLVRQSEQGITDRVSILLDTHEESHSPGNPSETFETAIRVVASLGAKHIKDGFAVTVESNAVSLAKALRGLRGRIPLLDALARVQPVAVPLGEVVGRMLADPQLNTHLVVVTPYLSRDAARKLRLLIDRGISVLLCLVQWEDSDPESIHRAGTLGCNVVEVDPNNPLQPSFRKVMGAATHR